ncbi:unnamed protein product [Amoebophrya sp. A25]|nr:unnamed protein product [Amoebophrya sp. A25]|eukprot:GSA25T00017619001.1
MKSSRMPSDESTRSSESPVRRRDEDADAQLAHDAKNENAAGEAAIFPPAKSTSEKPQPITATSSTSTSTSSAKTSVNKRTRSSASSTAPSKNSGGVLSSAYALMLQPFLVELAQLCNLKHVEDFRTFWIVGTYYALVFLRWRLYQIDPRYNEGLQSAVASDASTLQRITSHAQRAFIAYPSSWHALSVAATGEEGVAFTAWIRVALGCLDLLWIVATCSFAFFSATIVHNCIHFAQFRNYHVNTLWNIVLTHTYGHPVSTLIPGHNLSHHKYVQTPKDIMRTTRMQWRWNLINCLMFAPSIAWNTAQQDAKYFKVAYEKGNVWMFYRMRIEQISYYPLQVYLAYCHFYAWWWVILVPQLWAKLALITMNMLQHDGCLVLRELGETPDPYIAIGSQTVVKAPGESGFQAETIFDASAKKLKPRIIARGAAADDTSEDAAVEDDTDSTSASEEKGDASSNLANTEKTTAENDDSLWDPDYNFARDFVGPWINFFTCNNGYHTAHHLRPSMHWTRYPDLSRKLVEKQQHPALRVENLPWYAFRCFALGKRITWDGRPYFPNEANYDMDWVDVFFGHVSNAATILN